MAYSASNWTMSIGPQGPARVRNDGRFVSVTFLPSIGSSQPSLEMIKACLLTGRVMVRVPDALSRQTTNILNRFLELANASDIYEFAVFNGVMYLKNKRRNTSRAVTNRGIAFQLMPISCFYLMRKRESAWYRIGEGVNSWIENFEEAREGAPF